MMALSVVGAPEGAHTCLSRRYVPSDQARGRTRETEVIIKRIKEMNFSSGSSHA